MPIWLIETFGARDLDRAFYLILLMTAPVWIAMLAAPEGKWTARFAHPLVAPPLFCLVLFVLLWKSYEASLMPKPFVSLDYSTAREFARHPMAFLALFCNLQILNLSAGCFMFQTARRGGFKAPVELVLCWLLGAVALAPFGLRLLWRRRPGR